MLHSDLTMPSANPAKRHRHLAATLAFAVLLVGCLPAQAQERNRQKSSEIVATEHGAVRGVTKNGVRTFLGMPFAAPPVGDLRWRPPAPPQNWSGVRRSVAYGNMCAQTKRLLDFADASTSEDCLYINVFAPAKASAKRKRPVMVWIHGGGHTVGASDGHDGSALVRETDVLVVTFNYRLNAFGFLVHPALDGGGKTTNYGLLDQQAALRWVKRNIAAFGGDPGNVTIFGESAGGMGVLYHLLSPQSKGLFHRAIVQSGAVYWRKLPTLQEAEARGQAFAKAAGCADQSASCLRSLPVEKILPLSAQFNVAARDGETLTMTYRDAFESGKFNRVPILNGANRDEFRWFTALNEINSKRVLAADQYQNQLVASFGAEAAPEVGRLYPLSAYGSPSEALSAAVGDGTFLLCPARSLNLAASQHVPVFSYRFDDPTSPQVFPAVSFPYGAAHTSEIQYIFSGYKGVRKDELPKLTPAQAKLGRQMRAYWGAFAASGDPNSRQAPRWPRFTSARQTTQLLKTPAPVPTAEYAGDHKCAFWDAYNRAAYDKAK